MSGTEILIGVVTIAVLYFGNSAWTTFLENRKETRMQEAGDETQRATLEALKFSSEQETKRTQILADLAKKDDRVERIERLAYDTHTEVVKALATVRESRIEGNELSSDVAEFLTRNARRTSNPARLDGSYRLMKLDWSDPSAFRVKVFNVMTGLQLDAVVQDDSLTGKYKEALKQAEWSRKPVKLRITARAFGDNIYRDAIITHAALESDADESI